MSYARAFVRACIVGWRSLWRANGTFRPPESAEREAQPAPIVARTLTRRAHLIPAANARSGGVRRRFGFTSCTRPAMMAAEVVKVVSSSTGILSPRA